MDENVTTMIVAVSASVISPVLMAFLTWRIAKSNKDEDWARQDAVAAAAAQASAHLIAINSAAAEAAQESAAAAVVQSQHIADVTDNIHILVNSNLTAAVRATLEASRTKLWALRIAAKGDDVAAKEAQQLIKTTEVGVAELEAQLQDRAGAQAVVDAKPDPKEKAVVP